MSYWKLLLIVFTCLVITACSSENLEFEGMAKHENMIENSEYGKIDMSFDRLDGVDIRSFESKIGKEYSFQIDYMVIEGDIRIEFKDSSDYVVQEFTIVAEEFKGYLSEYKSIEDMKQHKKSKTFNIISDDDKLKVCVDGQVAKGAITITW